VLNVTVNSIPTTAFPYGGVGYVFYSCVDASAYAGIRFTLSGTLSGCIMSFAVGFSGDEPCGNSFGTCSGQCALPTSAAISVAASPTSVTIPFSSLTGGMPVPSVDRTHLTDLQWVFGIPQAGCSGTITIDNIAFVP